MAEGQDTEDRTEEATPKRRQEARDEGQVARSKELGTMAMLLLAGAGFAISGPGVARAFRDVMRTSFTPDRAHIFNAQLLPGQFLAALEHMAASLIPFAALMAIVALVSPLALGGWSFSSKSLGFKWDRLDPVKGLGRVFAWNGLAELLKALVKFVLVAGVAVLVLWNDAHRLIGLGTESLHAGLADAMHMVLHAFLIVSASTIIIAAVDVPFQLWEHSRKLKMTKQEVRDEMKDTEGRPEVKGRIRSIQQEMARRRMMEEVPRADVVVTNPTHYAVALRYDPDGMGAPRVVAKGADLVAEQIRLLARQHRVTLLSSPPLARALFHSTKIGQEIPNGLYVAVAQVLAYVYQLRNPNAQGGAPVPPDPDTLPIPDDLRREG